MRQLMEVDCTVGAAVAGGGAIINPEGSRLLPAEGGTGLMGLVEGAGAGAAGAGTADAALDVFQDTFAGAALTGVGAGGAGCDVGGIDLRR